MYEYLALFKFDRFTLYVVIEIRIRVKKLSLDSFMIA